MGEFQNIFRQLRLSASLTQSDIAKRIGISRSTIGMYETGAREPDFKTLEKIADYFNVDTDYLLGRTNKTTLLPETIEKNLIRNNDETQLLSSFRQLNRTGKGKVVDYAADLTKLPNYTEPEAEDNTESNPISEESVLIAAHNGHAEEPGQLELMNRDVALAKEIHRIIHSKQ